MLLTVGHAALDRDALTRLLRSASVTHLVDVRRFPGSRSNPDVKRDALERWLPEAGIDYRWEERLGGRRHLRKEDDAVSPDTWWQVAAFRAYAGWTRSADFGAAMTELLEQATDDAGVVVMCSEAVWWRCHRRLIADVAVLGHDVEVRHLMHDGARRPHPVAEGARRKGPGTLVWDGA
ncbi:DUF488 domain-containing protein [Georgenia subflava]|uniref:DUF488 family protein n=1 Tax=Georgenia subflava TaxID=1622177 RepID=A0A6N7EIQ1_9MICO|nr:DUF488 domain-containing protein [Georgenia subflava]MPV36607.1 DUF488 family protein [Georgenia subflava]